MDVTYDASSESNRRAIKRALAADGYKVSDSPARMSYPFPVRIWRVDPAAEGDVVAAILAVDSKARPVVPPPAYTHS